MKNKILILLSLLFAFVLAFAACDNTSESSSVATCTVTFDVNGGDELDEDTREVAVGERIGTLPNPIKDGYDFVGWYEEDDTDYETKYKSGTKVNSDITLVARWELSDDDKTDDSSSDGNGGSESSSGGDATVCEHNWSTVSRTEATCTKDGIRTSKCTKCGERKTETVDVASGHSYVYTNTDATCTVAAKKITTCKNCDLREEEVTAPATGVHVYLDVWKTTLEPTAYSCGSKYTTCKSCGARKTSIINPTLYDTFGMLPIKSLTFSGINVSGDTLSDVTIVNVASTAYAEASSCYRTTLPKNMFDGDTSTYWQADTLVEKNGYTGDWVTIHLAQEYEVCAVEFIVPNYYAWNIGAGCTVKYDIEVYVDGQWIKAGTLSDTDAQDGVSQNATVTCYLDKAYTTDTIRATVTHATRYAPALIYEAKVYANVGSDNITRTATSIAPSANVSVSGFYNSWTGADSSCLIDGSVSTSWMTDARDWLVNGHYDTNYAISYNSEKSVTKIVIKADKLVGETVVIRYKNSSDEYVDLGKFTITESDAQSFEYVLNLSDVKDAKELRFWVSGYGDDEQGYENTITSIEVTASGETTVYDNIEWTLKKTTWAQFEYTEPQFIAYIEWYSSNDAGRKFSLQFWKEDASYPAGGYWKEFGQYATTGGGSPYRFTVDVGETYKKFRLQIIEDSSYWTSYVYEITPYTISEIAIDVPEQDSSVCLHKYAKTSANETIKATCTSNGYSVYQCRSCDYTWKTDATDILEHTWGSASASTDANGNKVSVYNCTACTSGTKTVINEYKTDNGSYVTAPSITSFYHNGNGCWSMTFDDGNYIDTYEWVIPQLQKYNYKATLVATVAYVESYTSNWQRYFATGTFDLGSHSYAHGSIYGSALNESALMDDVNRAHFKLLNMFPGQRLLGFATPNGTTSNDTAHFVTDIMGAGRNGSALNGGMTDISTLTTRSAWGNLNSYISKSDETEGTYEYVKKNSVVTNYVYSESANKLTNQPNLTGTYYYVADEWRYEWRESGSYNKVGNEYVYVNDNSGEYVLAHTVLGSYEKAIDTLVSGKYWTVECIHSLGAGDIYSTYDSTISKFEYLKKTGVWVGSYTEAIQYIKESQSATIENMSATSSQISFTLTDSLDDYMFNHALTLTLELPAGWTDVTVTQNGVEIPMCSAEEYNPNMEEELVCTVINGTLYLDAVPDGGEVVITKK